jgi:hypothetical protein
MKKVIIIVCLLFFVATCANAQKIENQLITLITQSKKVVIHNIHRSDMCAGITRTTIDRDGKAWMFDLYASKESNHFERVIVVQSSQWYISRECLEISSKSVISTSESPVIQLTKRFKIDRLTNVLLRYTKPDKPFKTDNVLAIR